MFKKVLKQIAFNARISKLFAKREDLLTIKEAARKSGMNLGAFEIMSRVIDRRIRRIESALFLAGKLHTLRFETAVA